MKVYLVLFYLVQFFSNVYAQYHIVNETICNNNIIYTLEYTEEILAESGSGGLETYSNRFWDESKPAEISLHGNDLFFAIPANSTPDIKYEILSEEKVEYFPGINPDTRRDKNKILYKKSFTPLYIKKPFLYVNGYLWINSNYSLHLSLNPVYLNSENKLIRAVKFKIELSFDRNIKINYSKADSPVNDLVINKKFARRVMSEPQFHTNENDSWIDYSKTYLKIGVGAEGIYRITQRDLIDNGIDVSSINPDTFKLYLKGKQIPVYLSNTNHQNFDEDDYLEFFGVRNMGGRHRGVSLAGEEYNEYLGRYTDTTVYFLTWNGEKGLRSDTANLEPTNSSGTLYYYSQIQHYEKNNWLDYSTKGTVNREMPFWTGNKTWHEGNLGVGISRKNFSVSDAVPGKEAVILIKLQDYASDISEKAHLITMSLNQGQWSDSNYIDKYEQAVLKYKINSQLLNEGVNQLDIKSIPTNANLNACIFDWFEIEYSRYLKLQNGRLGFQFPYMEEEKIYMINLSNLPAGNLIIWRKGNSYRRISIHSKNSSGVFSDSVNPHNQYYAALEDSVKSPVFYYAGKIKKLDEAVIQADYIAVTHDKFMDKAAEYCSFIENAYGISAKLIDVEDIYNQYSFGLFKPEAIREFFKSAYNSWKYPKPGYALLIGGASYDYYGNKYKNSESVKYRALNYVPSFGYPVSDNWFTVWDTTGACLPKINIGRIPVTENSQLEWYLKKHKDYAEREYDDWNKRYLFFSSGDAESQSELDILRSSNQFVIDNYAAPKPVGGQYEHFYKTRNPPANFGPYSSEYFQNAVDKGGMIISYLGHSGTQIWDNTITSPIQLKSGDKRYPLVTDFGCSTGKFAEPDITSFSELFTVGENGEAIVYIGNSSLGFISTSVLAPKIFYRKILSENILNISEALNEAKLEMLKIYGASGVYKLFVLTSTLIGDPLITLPVPAKPNLIIKGINSGSYDNRITDLNDSTEVEIIFRNLGMVSEESFELLIKHTYPGIADSQLIELKVPEFEDSVFVKLRVKNKPGYHSIAAVLDPRNKIDEIYEHDNNYVYGFNVYSSQIRPLLQYRYNNGVNDKLIFLNPAELPSEEIMILELTSEEDFSGGKTFKVPFGYAATEIKLGDLEGNKRWRGRTKIKGENIYSPEFSFYKGESKYILRDSVSASEIQGSNIKNKSGYWRIDSARVKFEIFSAGFEDGQSAVISRNGINYIPTPRVGHHVVLFSSTPPYEFIEYKYFNTFSGGSEEIKKYITFLDTLPDGTLAAFAVSDEGTPGSGELINLIKSFGSNFIEDVRFRSSWGFMGQKKISGGIKIEKLSNAGEGPAVIDTAICVPNKSGTLITSEIGPARKWEKILIDQELPPGAGITFMPVGIRNDGSADTLNSLLMDNSESDLSRIDAAEYPKIKVMAEFKAGKNYISPQLNSFGVDYKSPPELVINYQCVSLEKDSLNAGEDIRFNFDIFNAGESRADSFYVEVYLTNENKSTSINVFNEFVLSIDSLQKKTFALSYNTAELSGNFNFNIIIDSVDNILEQYEDNNYYSIPFYVKPDTTKPDISLTFDGKDIFDGEYISPRPNIRIELTDHSLVPVRDTSSVILFLDDELVYYSNNTQIIYSVSNTNPKYVVEFTPDLADGEHSISVYAKDASGNPAVQNGLTKSFVVSNKVKLMDLYNYPNPFAGDTYFTFKLTQIPDEIRIKVYTVAGRLVKEIRAVSSELNYDFNKIYWDGRDEDGNLLGNGIYFYKVIISTGNLSEGIIQKLAIVR